MASDGMKYLLINAGIILLFVTVVMLFGLNISNNYGKDLSGITNGNYNFTAINNSVNSINAQANTSLDVFKQDDESKLEFVQDLFIAGTSMFGIIFNMVGLVFKVFDVVIIDSLNRVLGVPPIVTNTVLGLVVIVILFSAYRLFKAGD